MCLRLLSSVDANDHARLVSRQIQVGGGWPIHPDRDSKLGARKHSSAKMLHTVNLPLGYNSIMGRKSATSKAARALGKLSVQRRKEKWGEKEFNRRMQEWGKLGGRPKGTTKKRNLER